MIWTTAEAYDFEPEYMAFLPSGQPDPYMNAIIGFVHKHYDPAVMARLFSAFDQTLLEEIYTGLLWIGLEKAVFEREEPERPVLLELREKAALRFFSEERSMSRQQWMAQNSFVHSMQAARWRTVLGRPDGLLIPWKKKLLAALSAYNGSMDANELYRITMDIFGKFFLFNEAGARRRIHLRVRGLLGKLLARTPSGQVVRNDVLELGKSGAEGASQISYSKSGETVAEDSKKDYSYIESCFGRPLYSPKETLQLEHKLCSGNHQGCHLYVTRGEKSRGHSSSEAQKLSADAALQRKKNRAWYQAHQRFYEASTARLAAEIKNSMLLCEAPDISRAKSGQLSAKDAWRGVFLQDPRIFRTKEEQAQSSFSVDLMLDASASRMGSQELIASQAYVIARSLARCHIPVEVYSFLSLRGYTVLRLFCDLKTPSDADRIFDYYAAGWNRDGLALRGAAKLMEDSGVKNHILIVLTDANPNDDHRIPATEENGYVLSRSYAEEPGISDTAAEVQALRRQHIEVMAILNGSGTPADTVKRIYGDSFVRIQKIEQFSSAVGKLLSREIMKHTA